MITTCNQPSCRQLMDLIYQTGFALDDVLLYLDTHPCDQAALDYYHRIVDSHQNAVSMYQTNCGPLTAEQVNSGNYWSWSSGKWPWEGGSCSCGDTKNACNIR